MSGYELTFPLTIDPNLFIGKKPIAVLFCDERVEVKTWREVYTTILKRCNSNPRHHETMMELRGRLAGKIRVFLSDSPKTMRNPVKVDEEMYAESHYGAATLIHILTIRILKPVGFDYSNIRVVLKN